MSEQETISLAEAVAIWLETGELPAKAEPILRRAEDDEDTLYCQLGQGCYFRSHKDQRFVKPVIRKTARAELEEKLKEGYPGVMWDINRMLATRIDELEKKVK